MAKRQFGPFTEVEDRSGGMHAVDPILGEPLKYDEGFENNGDIWDYEDTDAAYEAFNKSYNTPGEAVKDIMAMGLPAKVQGPLGCGCSEAVLHGVGEIKNGRVEVDYMCDSGWHNFLVFQMRVQGKKPDREVKIDKYGGLTTEKAFTAQELQEF